MISGNRDVAQPPAARTRNPSEAFQLYDLASLRQTDKVILEAAGDSEAMPSRAQHEFKETSSPTLFTPVVETPVYSDWRREPELSRQASETSLAARGTSALHQNASARSSTALLPRLASKTFFSSNSSKPYHPALITFRGRTMVGDDGFKLANLAFGMFLMGWADASNGAQLPFIQESFRLEYLEVATMFVANFFGWVLSAGINPYLTDRLGLGKTLVIGSCIQMGAFVVLSSAPPFAVVDIAFVMVGLGIGIVNASSTAWTANQKKPHLKLGFVLATYGLGALLAPIAAGFLNKAGVIWSRFYLASLGLAVTNTVLLLASFRLESEESWIRRKNHHKEQRDRQQKNEQRSKRTSEENEAIAAEDGSAVGNDNNSLAASSAPTLSHRKPSIAQRTGDLRDQWPSKHELQSRDRDAIDEEEIRIESAPSTRPASPVREIDASAHEVPYPSTSSKFKALRSMKVVWIFSIFAFANTGTEVSIGGWTSSYLRERGSGHEAEWIVSAFWAGLMVARAVLIPVSAWIGEQRAIYIYLGSWLALELVVWFVPNLVSKAVATALAGVALGPCFPILAGLATQMIRPRALHTAALGLMGTAAQSGSAFFPFLVGLLAQAKGVSILPPFVVACLVLQICVWMFLGWPSRRVQGTSEDYRHRRHFCLSSPCEAPASSDRHHSFTTLSF